MGSSSPEGETGPVASAAAIGDAVSNAAGIRVHDPPSTIDKPL
ncbi:hypothetical protein ACFU99_02185 [Streptomyces sp. NPDC057654]